MKRAVILTRISTHRQNIERQILELEKYCKENNYNIVKTISSVVSGRRKTERPDLDEIMLMAKKKEFDILIVTEISRISRKPIVLQNVISTLKKYKIPILFKNHGFITIDENGEDNFATNLIISIFSELAAEEVRQLSERVKSGLDAARAKGKKLGRPAVKESTDKILKKHNKVVKQLQGGKTVAEAAKLTGKSFNTCKKVAFLYSQHSIN